MHDSLVKSCTILMRTRDIPSCGRPTLLQKYAACQAVFMLLNYYSVNTMTNGEMQLNSVCFKNRIKCPILWHRHTPEVKNTECLLTLELCTLRKRMFALRRVWTSFIEPWTILLFLSVTFYFIFSSRATVLSMLWLCACPCDIEKKK